MTKILVNLIPTILASGAGMPSLTAVNENFPVSPPRAWASPARRNAA